MGEIGIRELKEKASEVIRKVQEAQATYTVTHRGRAVARIVPLAERRLVEEAEEDALWAEIDELAARLGRKRAMEGSPVDAVSEQRR
jgi:prevent-host-death family protein